MRMKIGRRGERMCDAASGRFLQRFYRRRNQLKRRWRRGGWWWRHWTSGGGGARAVAFWGLTASSVER